MAPNATHAEYEASAGAWSRARDVIAGEDALKAAGARYLPRLDVQSDDEYDAYVARASFFNATARTAEGFAGLVFRRMPWVKVGGKSEIRNQKCGKWKVRLGRQKGTMAGFEPGDKYEPYYGLTPTTG